MIRINWKKCIIATGILVMLLSFMAVWVQFVVDMVSANAACLATIHNTLQI